MQIYQMTLKYQGIKEKMENKRTASTVDVNDVLKDLSELDPFESYIPEVPKFVIDWYKDIEDEFYVVLERLVLNYKNNTHIPICKWFSENKDALKILINMHQFGYKIEKEKKYRVKIKNINSEDCYLKRVANSWIISNHNEREGIYIYIQRTRRKSLKRVASVKYSTAHCLKL